MHPMIIQFASMVPCVLVPANHVERAKQIIKESKHSSQNEQDDEQEE